MIWGQGDGSGLRAVNSTVGRIGQLACWEHYNPLARYAMMADGEQIHSAMYPGSIFGDLFAQQTEITARFFKTLVTRALRSFSLMKQAIGGGRRRDRGQKLVC